MNRLWWARRAGVLVAAATVVLLSVCPVRVVASVDKIGIGRTHEIEARRVKFSTQILILDEAKQEEEVRGFASSLVSFPVRGIDRQSRSREIAFRPPAGYDIAMHRQNPPFVIRRSWEIAAFGERRADSESLQEPRGLPVIVDVAMNRSRQSIVPVRYRHISDDDMRTFGRGQQVHAFLGGVRTNAGEDERTYQSDGFGDRHEQEPLIDVSLPSRSPGLISGSFGLVGGNPYLLLGNPKLFPGDPKRFLSKLLFGGVCLLICAYGFALLAHGRTRLGIGLVLSGWITLTLAVAGIFRV